MRTTIITILLITGATLLGAFNLQAQQNGFSLTVKVSELRNAKGHVQFALYNQAGSIPDQHYEKYFKLANAEILNRSATVTFQDLPKGTTP